MKAEKIMVLDTETADLSGHVYDVGFTITNRKGEIRYEYNALVDENFRDAKKMMGAFYARKLFTHYAPMLQAGEIQLTPWAEIVETIRNMANFYEIDTLAAYNLPFDRRVMRQTNKLLGDGPIFDRPVKQLCIWRFACETKLKTKLYRRVAEEQGWVSNAGNLRSGAQYAYRFCRGDWGFIEDHTALSDARIETAILADCFAMKKKVPYEPTTGGPAWRLIQE